MASLQDQDPVEPLRAAMVTALREPSMGEFAVAPMSKPDERRPIEDHARTPARSHALMPERPYRLAMSHPSDSPPPGTTVQRHTRIIDVHVLLIDTDHVLLALRQGTGYAAIWTELAEA